jgi:uncharacterized protein YceK
MTIRSMSAIALAVCVALAGCSSYYKVRDTASGKEYYTTDVDKAGGGAVSFKDGRTGNKVTLQNSEVTKVPQDIYRQQVGAAAAGQ